MQLSDLLTVMGLIFAVFALKDADERRLIWLKISAKRFWIPSLLVLLWIHSLICWSFCVSKLGRPFIWFQSDAGISPNALAYLITIFSLFIGMWYVSKCRLPNNDKAKELLQSFFFSGEYKRLVDLLEKYVFSGFNAKSITQSNSIEHWFIFEIMPRQEFVKFIAKERPYLIEKSFKSIPYDHLSTFLLAYPYAIYTLRDDSIGHELWSNVHDSGISDNYFSLTDIRHLRPLECITDQHQLTAVVEEVGNLINNDLQSELLPKENLSRKFSVQEVHRNVLVVDPIFQGITLINLLVTSNIALGNFKEKFPYMTVSYIQDSLVKYGNLIWRDDGNQEFSTRGYWYIYQLYRLQNEWIKAAISSKNTEVLEQIIYSSILTISNLADHAKLNKKFVLERTQFFVKNVLLNIDYFSHKSIIDISNVFLKRHDLFNAALINNLRLIDIDAARYERFSKRTRICAKVFLRWKRGINERNRTHF